MANGGSPAPELPPIAPTPPVALLHLLQTQHYLQAQPDAPQLQPGPVPQLKLVSLQTSVCRKTRQRCKNTFS